MMPLLAMVAMAFGAMTSNAEIRFGDGSERHREHAREVAQYGRFFATTDYGDLGRDWKSYLRGRNVKGPGASPSFGKPWTSDGERTLFGITFDYPLGKPNYGQVDYSKAVPLIDMAIIWWGNDPPVPGSWRAGALTTDGQFVNLNPDASQPLYAMDRSTLRFAPMKIKTFYVGLKGREDGVDRFVSVRGIKLLAVADSDQRLTNHMCVSVPDLYRAWFSDTAPGMIDTLTAVHAFSGYGSTLPTFKWMTPFIDYQGKHLFPAKKDSPVTVSQSGGDATADYSLSFDASGGKPIDLRVQAVFRDSPDKTLEFRFRCPDLPAGAKIGYEFYVPAAAAIAERTPTLSSDPARLRTPAGTTTVSLKGADHWTLAKADGRSVMMDWSMKPVDWLRVETVASGPELDLAIAPPLGAAGEPQPEILNYTWRPSAADSGDAGIAPFKWSDLELLEEIDCGNPNDPHVFYDITNDRTIDALVRKYGKARVNNQYAQDLWGYTSFFFAEDTARFAVPLKTIQGQRCRAIPDEMGSYFRYDLDTHLEPRTPYLVVVDHAFDQSRRGAFYSIAFDAKTGELVASRGLMGGLESEAAPEGGFKTEAVLCYFQGLSHPEGRRIKARYSLALANKSHSGPWIKTPGLAISRIRVYRVKTMPELPSLVQLAPPPEKRRSLTIWSELDRGQDAWYLFQYPKLVGYDAIMTHQIQGSGFFGSYWFGAPTERHGWVHVGTLAGNEMLFAAAAEENLTINIHLGELLHLGFEGTDHYSFIQPWDSKGEIIPFQPTEAERARVAEALRKAMPKLAKYRSLRDVSMAFWPPTTLTWRNLEDFRWATGARITPSPLYIENIQSLLSGGPELIEKWEKWACAERFKTTRWLLGELKKYRPDIFITLLRSWDHGLLEQMIAYDSIPGADRQTLAAVGLKTYVDRLRFLGFDPDLYQGDSDFCFELDASPVLRKGKEISDYYDTAWFRQLRADFAAGGLGMMVHCATLEATVPLQMYHCPFMVPKRHYRRELVRAMMSANPRNVTMGAYNWPWEARLADFREFAVPYRLLPFAAPEPYDGALSDPTGQAVIHRYGNRYGLINAGDKTTKVALTLPKGKSAVVDLSSGRPEKLDTASANGVFSTTISMTPWSLKTLDIQ